MNTLILKLGATGDVVRTTPFLRHLEGDITWITAEKNVALLDGTHERLKCFSWENRHLAPKLAYDLLINLEDTVEVGQFAQSLKAKRTFGAYLETGDALRYTEDARAWFDLSLISRYGRHQADQLKLQNRKTYQELVFAGLGWRFTNDDTYLLPRGTDTGLAGDVAIAAEAGPVWPMKNWAYYGQLRQALEKRGLKVNVLPKRPTLLEHLADVRNHRCLVGGDSLPMHFALGCNRRCVTIFNCTSPWEIHDYGLQTKLISPLLEEFFYRRNFDARATTAITLEEVLRAVLAQVEAGLAAK
jgi:lipopolysaccharide heptosyltransferase II